MSNAYKVNNKKICFKFTLFLYLFGFYFLPTLCFRVFSFLKIVQNSFKLLNFNQYFYNIKFSAV